MTDIYFDKTNAMETLAGVFEADDTVSYFYLYKTGPDSGVIGALQVCSGTPDFALSDVDIQWRENQSKVGLLIRGRLWALFDLSSGRGSVGRYPTSPLEWS